MIGTFWTLRTGSDTGEEYMWWESGYLDWFRGEILPLTTAIEATRYLLPSVPGVSLWNNGKKYGKE